MPAIKVANGLWHRGRRPYGRAASSGGADGQPVRPIHFISRPFTVGSDEGCWWGWTSYAGSERPVGGYLAGTTGAAVRSFTGSGRDYVIVDAPTLNMVQLRKGVFVTVPVTFSWGIKGGFSHNASIGIGLRWTRSSTSASTRRRTLGRFSSPIARTCVTSDSTSTFLVTRRSARAGSRATGKW